MAELNRKIRVGAVSYLNTKPLIYGFNHGEMADEIDLVVEYPSKIAGMLISGDIDLGLVPVAVIPQLTEFHIVSDYCIGCDGEVGSVCLFSDVPLENIEKIVLDYQSRTSVELLKILLKEWWKISPELVTTGEDFRNEISGTTAGLVIGDRALEQRKISLYKYDLGLEWKKFTGLPFVFAAWISNKKLDPQFISSFNASNYEGLQHIDKVVEENETGLFDLTLYYTLYIRYQLDEQAKEGLQLFLQKLAKERQSNN
jgi:chorismate dehydratase